MGRRGVRSYGCICVVSWWADEGGNVSVQQWCFCASWEPSSTVEDRGGDGSDGSLVLQLGTGVGMMVMGA